MLRTPEALIPYFLAAAILAAGGMWHAADRLSARQVLTVGTPQVGGPFALVDQNGDTKTDTDFRGRWMLVYFGYTNCPDVCPATLSLMAAVMDRMGGRAQRIVPIFITVDPERDTPKILKQYLAAFGSRFMGLSGAPSHIASAAFAYRVYVHKRPMPGGGYAMDHSSVIYLMDPRGKFADDYDTSQSPDEIAADLRKRM